MKKRIALVTHSLDHRGGVATMTAFLYRVLEQSGRYAPGIVSLATSASDDCSLRLLTPGTWLRGPRSERREWHGLPYLHVGANLAELEPWRYRPRRVLTEVMRQYDLVQFVVGTAAWGCAAPDLGRPRLLCVAATAREDRVSRSRSGGTLRRPWFELMTRMAMAMEKDALRAADFVFVLSPHTHDALRATVMPDRMAVAPCGIDTNLFRPTDLDSDNHILAVGRFSDPRKNVRLLLEAYVLAARRGFDFPELCLIGEPPGDGLLKGIRDSGVASKVRFLRELPEASLAERYRRARFLVMSSSEEGLGIVILEAMSSGIPVISTRCGGPEWIIREGENGLLVPVGDAEALADAMCRLNSDADLRRRLSAAARQTVVQRFSFEKAGLIYLRKYDELLEGRV